MIKYCKRYCDTYLNILKVHFHYLNRAYFCACVYIIPEIIVISNWLSYTCSVLQNADKKISKQLQKKKKKKNKNQSLIK